MAMESKRKLNDTAGTLTDDSSALKNSGGTSNGETHKKRKTSLVKNLLIAPRYVNSYMHKDEIQCIAKYDRILMTGSVDGAIKFWDTIPVRSEGDEQHALEFIKQYQTNGSVLQMRVNDIEGTMATLSEGEKAVRIFDMKSFDLINIVNLEFEAAMLSFAYFKKELRIVLLKDTRDQIVIIEPEEGTELDSVQNLHNSKIQTIDYNSKYQCMISTDQNGMIEYWVPGDQYKKPDSVFEMKSKTNLYDIRKNKSSITGLTLSSDGEKFSTISLPDSKIRIFQFQSGKLIKEIDAKGLESANVAFDSSGDIVSYATPTGIHLLNLANNYTNLIGHDEDVQFSQVLLIEPALDKVTFEMASSISNDIINKKLSSAAKTILVATSREGQRFYVFDTSGTDVANNERDIYNESFTSTNKKSAQKVQFVTLQTNLGDIKIKLFSNEAPLAVENFLKLNHQNYYDNIIFHRIISGFMIQTGDPTGTGTGGESIWGENFRDEFDDSLRHYKYMVSMANAGPSTNGSQFFIVTSSEQLTHLDDKHTVFGKVVSGTDVVDAIQAVNVDDDDRPTDLVPRIISTTVSDK